MTSMKLSVVIPAYNEEANIENIVQLLLKNFENIIIEIIIINDCSKNNTAWILDRLSKENKKVIPLHRKGKNGVGRAIRAGLHKVSKKSNYVLLLDSDCIRNMKNIKEMIRHSDEADGILGSRFIKKNSLINYPIAKKVANRIFHMLVRQVLGLRQKDLSNNIKLYKKEIITKMLPYLTSTGFSINAETGIYPLLLGFHLKEVPVVWVGRTAQMGKSSFRVAQEGPGYVRVLLKALRLRYVKKEL